MNTLSSCFVLGHTQWRSGLTPSSALKYLSCWCSGDQMSHLEQSPGWPHPRHLDHSTFILFGPTLRLEYKFQPNALESSTQVIYIENSFLLIIS